MDGYEPKIIAFCCDQSGYPALEMAVDLVGDLPPNLEIVRVPCAGRIETLFLLRALEGGADGVILFACYEENCQYLRGNLRAKGRLSYAHHLLEKIGLEKERIEICHLATNSGLRLKETLQRKLEELRKLGPNPCKASNRDRSMDVQ